jgi:DNA polymerase zeta
VENYIEICSSSSSSSQDDIGNIKTVPDFQLAGEKKCYYLKPSFSVSSSSQLVENSVNSNFSSIINVQPFYGNRNDCLNESETSLVAGYRTTIKSTTLIRPFHESSFSDRFDQVLKPSASSLNKSISSNQKDLINGEISGNQQNLLVHDIDNDSYDYLSEKDLIKTFRKSDSIAVKCSNINKSFLLKPSFQLPSRLSSGSNKVDIESNGDISVPIISSPKQQKSQISSPTQTTTKKYDMKRDSVSRSHDVNMNEMKSIENTPAKMKSYVRICSMEVFCCSRSDSKVVLTPNPKHDPIEIICYIIEEIIADSETECKNVSFGVLNVLPDNSHDYNDPSYLKHSRIKRNLLKSTVFPPNMDFIFLKNEIDLILRFNQIMQEKDVDFYVGYEIQNKSFGYLIERSKVLHINSLQQLSKIPNEPPSRRNDYDTYAEEHNSGIFITGRIVLNLWKIMSQELKLSNYTYHNVAYNLLRQRIPVFSHGHMTRWYGHVFKQKYTFVQLYRLTKLNLDLLEKLDFIRRTSECARLYGIDFYSIISRGSQFRVEATLLKIAHKMGYIAISPSKKQVSNQAPMAVIPLVMEPISKFYEDPVVVLDFQSLYPSMIIAYNLCFSTILGKLSTGGGGNKDTNGNLGVISYPEKLTAEMAYLLDSDDQHIEFLKNNFNYSNINRADKLYDVNTNTFLAPNGSIFCSKSTRLGVLPTMLKDILETRFMIKRAMKRYSADSDSDGYDILRRVLDARQLSIKYLANVTYGYTGAGFSGRMPMAELADAIVQCGRSTLEWAMHYIQNHSNWKAEVVYGDTDSIFVRLPGRTKDQAISLGQEIALEITSKCPPNVVLKYEKVFFPCILASKKRYVGYAYETLQQKIGHFDAKVINMID